MHFSFLGLHSDSGGVSCHPCKVFITRVMTLERGCYSLVFAYVGIYTYLNQHSKHRILQSPAFEVCKCVIFGLQTPVSQPTVMALEHFHYCHKYFSVQAFL